MTDEREGIASQFEAHRTHLRNVAYRMLGSASDADDAVQEAWLRVSQAGADEVLNLRGWLTTVVARICSSYSSACPGLGVSKGGCRLCAVISCLMREVIQEA